MRHRTRIVALAAAATLTAAVAQAREVRYPAARPQVSLSVPDDWSVAETPLGLELQAPGKDALVVAGMTAGDRKSVEGWSKRALERVGSEGVVFTKPGAAKPRVAASEEAAAKPDATSKPTDPATDPTTNLAKANGDHPYTFGGAPVIDPRNAAMAGKPPTGGAKGADLPSISTEGLTPSTMKPSGHFAYVGGTLRGQPVDVELAVFPIGKDQRLLVEQQSGPTDARGVMIVRSMRELAP